METNKCLECELPLPENYRGGSYRHRSCYRSWYSRVKGAAIRAAWVKQNPDRVVASRRKFYIAHKAQFQEQKRQVAVRSKETVMEAYGCVCSCCGEAELAFLTIDHIDVGQF